MPLITTNIIDVCCRQMITQNATHLGSQVGTGEQQMRNAKLGTEKQSETIVEKHESNNAQKMPCQQISRAKCRL